MKRIIDEPCTNKTYKLLQYAKENDAMVVCSNVSSMRNKALSYNIVGIDFISYYDFIHFGTEGKKYCIDELEDLVKFLRWESDMVGYTITIGNWSEM